MVEPQFEFHLKLNAPSSGLRRSGKSRQSCTNPEGPNPASVLRRWEQYVVPQRSLHNLASCPELWDLGGCELGGFFLGHMSPGNEVIVSTYTEWVVAVQ